MADSQFSLTDDQLEVQNLVRRVASERIAPRANEIDHRAEYPQDIFDLLRSLGLFALPFPREYGGMSSMVASCVAIEELGRVCYNSAYLLLLQWLPFGAILSAGTLEQQRRLLKGLSDGSLRGAFSTTESQSGSDIAGIKTRAKRAADGYILNGSKIWCTNADVADFIIVAAKFECQGEDSVNLFIVEKGCRGLQVGKKEEKMGARGVPSCPLFFDNVFIPENNLMTGGFKSVMDAFNASRPLIGARAVGLAQGAIDHTIEFIRNRKSFDRHISDFQGVRWMISDMCMQTEAARQLVYAAAAQVDAGLPSSLRAPMASMAKCFSSDVAMKVATDAVQLFGAAGISAEYPINRYFRDAKVLQIIEGTNQIQRNIIANSLIGRATKK